MVMFNCNRCSTGLKKKDVEIHSYKCGGRVNINVTCIDCLKDFRGDEYTKHISCVTEEVRYGGKGLIAKPTGQKQNQWIGVVSTVLQKKYIDNSVRKFLESIKHLENIPRNLKKFQNWASSAVHVRDRSFSEKVFKILQAEFACNKEVNGQNGKEIKTKLDESAKPVPDENDDVVEKVEEKTSPNNVNDMDTTEESNLLESKPKKKKKKQKMEEPSEDAVDNAEPGSLPLEENGNHDVESALLKPKKKKKSKKTNGDCTIDSNDGITAETNGNEHTEEMTVTQQEIEPANVGNTMSKKERKKLLKKAKYEADLAVIGSEVPCDIKELEAEVTEEPKPKKSKKRKLAAEETVVEEDNDKTARPAEDSSVEKALEDGDNPPAKKRKFEWHNNIISVLKKSKDHQVSLKTLNKKIINEYISQYGDKNIHEKLNAKMKKKIHSCPGIKVVKDKVILEES